MLTTWTNYLELSTLSRYWTFWKEPVSYQKCKLMYFPFMQSLKCGNPIYICSVLMLMNEKTILTIVLQKWIYFFVGSWNVEGYTVICVSSHDRRDLFWVQRGWDLYQTWSSNMTPLFEDPAGTAPLRNS